MRACASSSPTTGRPAWPHRCKPACAPFPESATSVCILLGDMPGVPAGLVDALLDRIDAGAPAARPVHPDGPAHPVAFARSTFAQLMTLKGDAGARSVLQRLGGDLALVPIDDPGVVFDIDRPDDLDAAVSWVG
ncbi:NTP transferase domain-containing protein [Brevundimonas albigilva]|nr:NTP transferase domain-containing protein [Brevundimonas albigilva]UQV18133.1 NTP transferase domain-containing protein [Brevundimonas albigilva]